MKNILLFAAIVCIASIGTTKAHNPKSNPTMTMETSKDSTRLAELNRYWVALSKTVQEGDFEGYAATYHEDAVVIFASGENKVSLPISTALKSWKQGFQDTKAGKAKSNVAFRFSQRIGDETTAHETGIFHYTSANTESEKGESYLVHFEMLFVKREGSWYALMEYQKSDATEEEWEALK